MSETKPTTNENITGWSYIIGCISFGIWQRDFFAFLFLACILLVIEDFWGGSK